jgi:transcriptional regulator with XRE-family HTH domain
MLLGRMIAIDEKALAQQVGRCMKQARRARKWKQAQVAHAIGVTAEFYGRIERGGGLPSMATLAKLLALFELSPSAVLGWVQPAAEPAGCDAAESARDDTADAGRDDAAGASRDPPVLRRIARRLRRVPARGLALVRKLLDELDRQQRD